MAYPQHYTPKFQRHIYSVANNGFLTRALDADDIAFIEGIRERGCIGNGPMADSPPALIEELGYWERHWEVEDGFVRRIGRNIEESEARREARRLQLEAMRAKRLAEKAKRLADNAMAAAELACEEREWQRKQEALKKEREERLKQTMLADLEWEEADFAKQREENYYRRRRPEPYRGPRHYEPEWKAEERTAPLRRRHARNAKLQKLEIRRAAANPPAPASVQNKPIVNPRQEFAQPLREATLALVQPMPLPRPSLFFPGGRLVASYGVRMIVRWPHLRR
jgi:hypothetical protein